MRLRPGPPPEPAMAYRLSIETLRAIDLGEVNALTAMAAAHPDDPRPMSLTPMDGFRPPSQAFVERLFPFTFHFWTRGLSEIVPFGSDRTREVHGAHATVFYYEKGLRSAWIEMRKGEHANRDPRDQENPFPTMLIVVRGKDEGRIGGELVRAGEGQMIFLSAGVSHEFWNPHDEPVQGILLMFGEGA